MRTRAETIWIVGGAIVGGYIAGTWPAEPRMLWSMLGGLIGGLLGAGAASVIRQRWHPLLRLAAVAALLAGGYFLLFIVIGRQFVLDAAGHAHSP